MNTAGAARHDATAQDTRRGRPRQPGALAPTRPPAMNGVYRTTTRYKSEHSDDSTYDPACNTNIRNSYARLLLISGSPDPAALVRARRFLSCIDCVCETESSELSMLQYSAAVYRRPPRLATPKSQDARAKVTLLKSCKSASKHAGSGAREGRSQVRQNGEHQTSDTRER